MTYLSIDTFNEACRPVCALLGSAKANLQNWITLLRYTKSFICVFLDFNSYSLVVTLFLSQLGCMIYHSRTNIMLYSGTVNRKKSFLKFSLVFSEPAGHI